MRQVRAKKKAKDMCIISVTGQDRKGIIATVSNYLYRQNINIEDVSQRVIHDYFVMMIMADVAESKTGLEKVRDGLARIGRELGLHIQLQHEDIFKAMHRV
jgi:ACT domain-containing protein